MSMLQPGKRLRDLFARKKVLPVFGVPNALHAMIMEAAGFEAGFIGGAGTTGNYTGFSNTSIASMTELVSIGGYIARSVSFPLILDGDTGPGSLTALQRMVEDCIRAGIACVRFEDQPAGRKRQQAGKIEITSREEALIRLRAAIEVRDRLAPDFVIAAKTYARNAARGGLDEGIARLASYHEAGVDFLNFMSPHSVDEIKEVRRRVPGPIAIVDGPRLTLKENAELGVSVAWYTGELDKVLRVASWEFLRAFRADDAAAWEGFTTAHGASVKEVDALGLLSERALSELEERLKRVTTR